MVVIAILSCLLIFLKFHVSLPIISYVKITEVAQSVISRAEVIINEAAAKIAQAPEDFTVSDIVDLKTGELQYKAGVKLIKISQSLQDEVLKILE